MNFWLGWCTGVVGWPPDSFWKAQLWECRAAVRTYQRHHSADQRQWLAALINGMRQAFHKERWKGIEPDDLKGDDRGPDDPEQEREDLSSTFPTEIDR